MERDRCPRCGGDSWWRYLPLRAKPPRPPDTWHCWQCEPPGSGTYDPNIMELSHER